MSEDDDFSLGSDDDDEDYEECDLCGAEHPAFYLQDGYCPTCIDEMDEAAADDALVEWIEEHAKKGD
jgi:hypothetical protein